jgi:hypothetical protein
MPASFTIREGITDPIVFTLQSIDPDTEEASAVNLTGVQLVELKLRSRDGTVTKSFDTDGSQLEISDETNGEVTFSPGASDLDDAYEWYEGYFLVTDAEGKISSYPSDGEFELVVIEAFS